MTYENELKHYGVLGMKWGIRRARRKQAKANYKKAMSKAANLKDVTKATADYKKAKKDRSHDVEIANKLYSKQNKKANAAIARMSAGETFVQYSLMGSYGALKYNEAKAKGTSTGRAVAEGILYSIGDNFVYGALSTAQYLDNRAARKK